MRKEIKGICSTSVAGVVLKVLFVAVFVAVSTVFTASPEDATLSFQHKLVLMGKGQERVASWQFSLDIKTKHAKIHCCVFGTRKKLQFAVLFPSHDWTA